MATSLTKEQAEKLMKAATREAEQTIDGGKLRWMISVNVADARNALFGEPSASDEALKEACGGAFIRFSEDNGQRIHLDRTVLKEIAAPGLAR